MPSATATACQSPAGCGNIAPPRHICVSPESELLFGHPPNEPRTDWRYKTAPSACDWHRVWFDQAFVEDKTVHSLP